MKLKGKIKGKEALVRFLNKRIADQEKVRKEEQNSLTIIISAGAHITAYKEILDKINNVIEWPTWEE